MAKYNKNILEKRIGNNSKWFTMFVQECGHLVPYYGPNTESEWKNKNEVSNGQVEPKHP